MSALQRNIFAPKHWSFSALSLAGECPAAWWAKQQGEPQVVPPPVQMGSDLHDGIARHAQHCWERGVIKDPEAMQRIADGYGDEVRAELLQFAKDARWPWPKVKGGRDGESPVEQLWEATLPNGHLFVGRIDLAFTIQDANLANPFADSPDVVRIVDWKRSRPPGWGEQAIPLQLLCYPWMYQQSHPEAQEFDVMYGAPGWSGKWAFSSWHLSGDLSWIGRRLAATVDRIEAAREYPVRPGLRCNRCMYWAACPKRESLTVDFFRSLSPAGLAKQACLLGAHRSQVMAALKEEYEQTAVRVELDADNYVGEAPPSGYDTPNIEAAWALVQEAKDDLAGRKHSGLKRAWGGVAQDIIKKLLKSDKWRARAEGVFVKRTSGGDFGIHKRKPDEEDAEPEADE